MIMILMLHDHIIDKIQVIPTGWIVYLQFFR